MRSRLLRLSRDGGRSRLLSTFGGGATRAEALHQRRRGIRSRRSAAAPWQQPRHSARGGYLCGVRAFPISSGSNERATGCGRVSALCSKGGGENACEAALASGARPGSCRGSCGDARERCRRVAPQAAAGDVVRAQHDRAAQPTRRGSPQIEATPNSTARARSTTASQLRSSIRPRCRRHPMQFRVRASKA